MISNERSIYEQVNDIIVRAPNLVWVSYDTSRSREEGAIGSTRIEAFRVPISDTTFRNRLRPLMGQTLIFSRIGNRGIGQSPWRDLYDLFYRRECLVYRQSTKDKGLFNLYILVQEGLYFEGIKAKVIDVIYERW